MHFYKCIVEVKLHHVLWKKKYRNRVMPACWGEVVLQKVIGSIFIYALNLYCWTKNVSHDQDQISISSCCSANVLTRKVTEGYVLCENLLWSHYVFVCLSQRQCYMKSFPSASCSALFCLSSNKNFHLSFKGIPRTLLLLFM